MTTDILKLRDDINRQLAQRAPDLSDLQPLPRFEVRAEDLRPTPHGLSAYSARLAVRYPEAEEGDFVAVVVYTQTPTHPGSNTERRRWYLGRIAEIHERPHPHPCYRQVAEVILQPSGKWSTR